MGIVKQMTMEEAEKPCETHGDQGPCERICVCGHICSDHAPGGSQCSGNSECDCSEFVELSGESDGDIDEDEEDADFDRDVTPEPETSEP
jgi:hypothetical protein